MPEFAARIRNVRLKDGGTALYVLPREQADMATRFRSSVEHIINQPDCTLDGYVVIGFYADTMRLACYRMPNRIPRELAPAYVEEIMRTDAVTEDEFHRIFEWREC